MSIDYLMGAEGYANQLAGASLHNGSWQWVAKAVFFHRPPLTSEQNQMGKEYYKEYFAITEPMFIKPREFKILKRVGLPFTIAKDSNFK
jgi:hypothetical protein